MNQDPVFILYSMTKYLVSQLEFYKMKELFQSMALVAETVEPFWVRIPIKEYSTMTQ